MIDHPLYHVGHGFDASVGMHGETFDVIVRIAGAKMIEKQKRVKMVQGCSRNAAFETYAGAFFLGSDSIILSLFILGHGYTPIITDGENPL
jgi:hypothetical protein